MAWSGDDGVDHGRSVVYRDVIRGASVSDVSWLLMEPASHKIRRRQWVCLPIPNLVNSTPMYACM